MSRAVKKFDTVTFDMTEIQTNHHRKHTIEYFLTLEVRNKDPSCCVNICSKHFSIIDFLVFYLSITLTIFFKKCACYFSCVCLAILVCLLHFLKRTLALLDASERVYRTEFQKIS